MTTRRISAVLVALGAFAFPRVSQATSVTFCIFHTGSYNDNGIAAEDFWTDDSPKLAIGAQAMVWRNGSLIFNGELGDGFNGTTAGCTPALSITAAVWYFEFNVKSDGHVQSNRVYVTGGTTPESAVTAIYGDEFVHITGTIQVVGVTIPVAAGSAYDAMNIYQAGAWAMFRHAGGIQNHELRYHRDSPSEGSFYCATSQNHPSCPAAETVVVDPEDARKKFTIAHEAGHWIGDLRTQGVWDHETIDVGYDSDECPSGSHGMRSEEYAGGAAGEGWAHFYSADIWNDHDDSDCSSRTGGQTVDCQNANGVYVLRYHEVNCSGDDGYGVELDWMRQFWDVHTGGAAPDPTLNSIMSWLDGAGTWDSSNIYTVLNSAVDPLNDDIEVNWDANRFVNGVDH